MGTLCYSLNKIINVLDIEDADVPQFTRDFDNPDSKVYQAFCKGKDKADYVIDMKLFEKAKGGDLKALKEYEERKYMQQEMEKRDKSKR